MSTVAELRAAIVDVLTGAGIRATADPRNVNPPCVVVGLAEGARVTGCAFEGTIPVSVVSAGAGHADAADYLDATATSVAALIHPATWSPDVFPMPGQPVGLLAIVLTVPAAWEVTT